MVSKRRKRLRLLPNIWQQVTSLVKSLYFLAAKDRQLLKPSSIVSALGSVRKTSQVSLQAMDSSASTSLKTLWSDTMMNWESSSSLASEKLTTFQKYRMIFYLILPCTWSQIKKIEVAWCTMRILHQVGTKGRQWLSYTKVNWQSQPELILERKLSSTTLERAQS